MERPTNNQGDSLDPEILYNGGYLDFEDDPVEFGPDIHIFNPFLYDPGAVLDTYRPEKESGVGRDRNPPIDIWRKQTKNK